MCGIMAAQSRTAGKVSRSRCMSPDHLISGRDFRAPAGHLDIFSEVPGAQSGHLRALGQLYSSHPVCEFYKKVYTYSDIKDESFFDKIRAIQQF